MPDTAKAIRCFSVERGYQTTDSIVCTLSGAELQERRHKLLDSIRAKTAETLALSNDYAYKFKRSSEVLATLAQLIALEHQCYRFLTFKLIAEGGTEDVVLEITGPSDAKAFSQISSVLLNRRNHSMSRLARLLSPL